MFDDAPDSDISIIDELTSKEGCQRIIDGILSLQETLSDVLYLSVVYEYTNDEIAKLLNLDYNVVKMRLSRAKKAVRKILGEKTDGK